MPTRSAATDFYGADRLGDDLFANSLIALDAATGKRVSSSSGMTCGIETSLRHLHS